MSKLSRLQEKRCCGYEDRKWEAGEIIKDKLWIGSVIDAKNYDGLKERKINTVLTAARGLFVFGKGARNKPDFIKNRLVLKISDHPGQLILDRKVIGRAVEFIRVAMKDPDARILVHCASGVSRSVSMVLAYLIADKMYDSVDDALAFVRKNRPQASPNIGFRMQLEQLVESGRDLSRARETYLALIKKEESNPILVSIKQRDNASSIMQLTLDIGTRVAEKNIVGEDELKALDNRMKSTVAKMKSSVLCDRPAMSILKSARSKYESIVREMKKGNT